MNLAEKATELACDLAAQLEAERATSARLRNAIHGLLFPEHGTYGGPLVSVKAIYEDGSVRVVGHEPSVFARAALKGD